MPFCAIVVVVVVLCSVPRNVVDCLSLHLLSIVSRSISNPYGYIAHHTLLIYLLLLYVSYFYFYYISSICHRPLYYILLFFSTHTNISSSDRLLAWRAGFHASIVHDVFPCH